MIPEFGANEVAPALPHSEGRGPRQSTTNDECILCGGETIGPAQPTGVAAGDTDSDAGSPSV